MNFQIIEGKQPHAKKTTIYGVEGIGKTSLCSMLEDVLFMDTENGTKFLDTKRVIPASWEQALEMFDYVKTSKICKNFVIDSIDWLEHLCNDYLCRQHSVKSIESMNYGKGYVLLKEEMKKGLDKLDKIVEVGINVWLISHSQIRKFEQPEDMSSYDRYELKLSRQVASLIKEWCDNLLFVNYKSETIITDKGHLKQVGNKRMLYAERTSAFDAKNRCGLPAESEMSYKTLQLICSTTEPTPENQRKTLNLIADMIEDDGVQVDRIDEEQISPREKNIEKILSLINEKNISRDVFETKISEIAPSEKGKHLEEYSDKNLDIIIDNWRKICAKL